MGKRIVTLPLTGILRRAGKADKVAGDNLTALSLSDIYALVGSTPQGKTTKVIDEWRADGSAVCIIDAEDEAWLLLFDAALAANQTPEKRTTLRANFMKLAFTDATNP